MKKEKNKNSTMYLFLRLFNEHIKIYFSKILIALLLMIIVAAANAAHVWVVKPMLDEIFVNHDQQMLLIIPIFIISIAVIKGICSYYQNLLMKFIGQRMVTDIQARLYHHLIKSDVEYLSNISSGKLISRFTNDVTIMRHSITNFSVGIAKELFTVIFLIGVMFSLSITLSLIIFIIFPLAILPIIKMGRKMRKVSNDTQEELSNYTAKLDDTFQTIKIVKSFLREDFEIKKTKKMLEDIFMFYFKSIKTESFSSPIIELLSGVAIAFVIWYGGTNVIEGNMTPGTFFAFIAAFLTAYKPIKSLTDLNNNLQEGLSSAKRLFDVLDIKPRVINRVNEPLKLKSGNISISDISFAHQNSNRGIKNISVDILSGKTIALVGGSGSGKSTLIHLILRFYDVDKGSIKIDDVDIKHVTIESLRENISYVSQEVMLFDDSIFANIVYGKLEANKGEVEKAAKIADIHDFIITLPEGYDTMVGQHGHKLSGGQKQKIAIARAILKNSLILILDEATSSLDNVSERKIFDNLKQIRSNQTVIMVAHRLSTIIDANEIIVFKDGSIVEKGNHKKLLSKKGEYSKLYNASLSNDA